jgi:hypothetical protein
MEDFLDRIRTEWQDAKAATFSSSKLRDRYREWALRKLPLVNHWHWSVAYKRSFLEIFNSTMRIECFELMKGISLEGAEFGNNLWMAELFFVIPFRFPVGDLTGASEKSKNQEPFYVSLGMPPPDVYEQYKGKDIPVFTDDANRRLRSKSDKANTWRKFFRAYYAEYMKRVADIYLIVDPKDENAPRYRIVRSLAIAPDQRVFLVENIADRSQRVVKWEEFTSEALSIWTKVRNTGVKMLDFSTQYRLDVKQRVLLMETLSKIDHTDDIYKLLVEILQQLETLHRAGIVHADLKLDNIMKRVTDTTEYFIIDYDSVSYVPMRGVDNALIRKSYSPFWASQIAGDGDHPTSYRYDLEELFYAAGDLAKIKRRVKMGPRFVMDERADAETRWRANYEMQRLVRDTHLSEIIGDAYLTELFRKIMNCPERLPFSEINHGRLIDYVEAGMSKPSIQSVVPCGVCFAPSTSTFLHANEDGESIKVCSQRCATVLNPNQQMLAYHEAARCYRPRRGCIVCDAPPLLRCDNCKVRYCSSECHAKHEEHDLVCN